MLVSVYGYMHMVTKNLLNIKYVNIVTMDIKCTAVVK